MTRGGLTARVTRLETVDAAACTVCRGNPIRVEWARGPGQPREEDEQMADTPETCAGCGRRFKLILVRWQTDADEEVSR